VLAFTTVFCFALFILFVMANSDPLVDRGFEKPLQSIEQAAP